MAEEEFKDNAFFNNGKFRLIEKIGGGAFKEVWKAYDTQQGITVALKILKHSRSFPAYRNVSIESTFEREAKILTKLREERGKGHEHIAKIYFVNIDEKTGLPFIVEEYVEGRKLSEVAGKLDEKQLIECAEQICKGLDFLHSRGVTHGDLSLENLILSEGKIKIVDFGLSNSKELHYGPCYGSLLYRAPELLKGFMPSQQSDSWAAGVALYKLITGSFPFEDAERERLREKIISGEYERLKKAPLRKLISGFLQTNLKKRWSAKKACRYLWWRKNRKWFLGSAFVTTASFFIWLSSLVTDEKIYFISRLDDNFGINFVYPRSPLKETHNVVVFKKKEAKNLIKSSDGETVGVVIDNKLHYFFPKLGDVAESSGLSFYHKIKISPQCGCVAEKSWKTIRLAPLLKTEENKIKNLSTGYDDKSEWEAFEWFDFNWLVYANNEKKGKIYAYKIFGSESPIKLKIFEKKGYYVTALTFAKPGLFFSLAASPYHPKGESQNLLYFLALEKATLYDLASCQKKRKESCKNGVDKPKFVTKLPDQALAMYNSPDLKHFAIRYKGSSIVTIVNIADWPKLSIKKVSIPNNFFVNEDNIAWSQDSKGIAFSACPWFRFGQKQKDRDCEIFVYNIEKDKLEQLTDNDYEDFSPVWVAKQMRNPFSK
ncbi:MAG: serine/threonine-protein kinase [Candidatus Woesearchaeota archaeon]